MLNFKILFDVMGKEKTFQNKIKKLFLLIKYYNSLNKGISSGHIFHKIKNQDPTITQLFEKFTKQDNELVEKLFQKDVKEFFQRVKLKNHLDFDKKIGFDQVGINTIYVNNPIAGLWTTGKATFYIPTKKDFNNKVSLELESIPPVKVTIGLENEKIKTLNMPKMSKKKVEFVVESSSNTNSITELFVSTDKLWFPSVILENEESVTIGICVKTIDVSYF